MISALEVASNLNSPPSSRYSHISVVDKIGWVTHPHVVGGQNLGVADWVAPLQTFRRNKSGYLFHMHKYVMCSWWLCIDHSVLFVLHLDKICFIHVLADDEHPFRPIQPPASQTWPVARKVERSAVVVDRSCGSEVHLALKYSDFVATRSLNKIGK